MQFFIVTHFKRQMTIAMCIKCTLPVKSCVLNLVFIRTPLFVMKWWQIHCLQNAPRIASWSNSTLCFPSTSCAVCTWPACWTRSISPTTVINKPHVRDTHISNLNVATADMMPVSHIDKPAHVCICLLLNINIAAMKAHSSIHYYTVYPIKERVRDVYYFKRHEAIISLNVTIRLGNYFTILSFI